MKMGLSEVTGRGTKFALVGVSREILLRLPKAQEREEERGRQAGARIGSGSARPLCWLHGLMRKPIRREEEGKRRGRRERRKGAAKAQLFSY